MPIFKIFIKSTEYPIRLHHYESADCGSTGLISITGVPSIASIGPTLNPSAVISITVTRCKPSGFGLMGDRVAKIPVREAYSCQNEDAPSECRDEPRETT